MKIRIILAAAGALAGGLPVYAQNATPLSELLAEAAHANPDIRAAEHTWRAATHVRQQVTTLPNPQFTVQEFSVGSPKPFAGFNTSNFAYFGIGASQELPYPGKLRLKGEAADRAADVQQAQIVVMQASIANQVKAAYLRLAYLQQTLSLLESSRNILGQVIDSELLRYRTGAGNQADVLKAQLARTKLIKEVTMRREEIGQVQADLKRVLHRPQESPDIVAQDLAVTPLSYSSLELMNLVRKQNPEVKFQASAIEKQSAELRSAERAGKPDFSVGYMYQRTGEGFPAYYMLTFNLIFQRRERVRAEIEEAAESVKSTQEELDGQLQQQIADVQKQYVAAKSTAEELTEYREGMIPQADAGFHAVLVEYESNKQQLDSVLTSFNEVLELKRDYAQSLLDHEAAIARLETLTGVTLR
ncbi:MAG TPA: TolC family protein [Bryobacteraceae bacterium]|nr:TolC family protein [Bryobacteraceae bacterium]